jgi:hypothetical protein
MCRTNAPPHTIQNTQLKRDASDMPMERKAKGLLFAYNEPRLLIFCTEYEGRELFNQKIPMAQT